MVNGDTAGGGCEVTYGGCDIDFIVWSDMDSSQYSTVSWKATVAGINPNKHGRQYL